MDDIKGLTFLRFDYPYYTRYRGEFFEKRYVDGYHKLQGRILSTVDLAYPRKRGERIFVENFVVHNDIDEYLAELTKVKYNKIIGSICVDNILNSLRREMRGWTNQQVIEYFGEEDVIKLFEELFAQKANSLEDNVYLRLYVAGEELNSRNRLLSMNNGLLINLTKRKLKQIL